MAQWWISPSETIVGPVPDSQQISYENAGYQGPYSSRKAAQDAKGKPSTGSGGGTNPTLPGGKVTPQSWAESFLNAIGAPVNNANVNSVVSWEAIEGGNWHNTARFNPLNTTQPEQGSVAINSVGVQSYDTWSEGLSATVATIENGSYSDVLSSLRAGKGLFGGTFSGLSAWSGGAYDSLSQRPGYGGGAGATIGQQGQAQADPTTCLLAWPSAHIDVFFGHGPTVGGGCILAKSQARGLAGAAILIAGAGLLVIGANFLLLATIGSKVLPLAATAAKLAL